MFQKTRVCVEQVDNGFIIDRQEFTEEDQSEHDDDCPNAGWKTVSVKVASTREQMFALLANDAFPKDCDA